jgi:hypothetical protein
MNEPEISIGLAVIIFIFMIIFFSALYYIDFYIKKRIISSGFKEGAEALNKSNETNKEIAKLSDQVDQLNKKIEKLTDLVESKIR